jgi:hypothetical protein
VDAAKTGASATYSGHKMWQKQLVAIVAGDETGP